MNEIRPTMTPGKLAWLRQLERDGVADRPRGPVGRNTMVNGWTTWAARDAEGNVVDYWSIPRELRQADGFHSIGEMLTDKGREMLAAYRDTPAKRKRRK